MIRNGLCKAFRVMRRGRISPLGLAAILGILAAMGGENYAEEGNPASQAPPNRPNVLFIAVDDLNDWTGFLKGHPQTRTPNLDALAARGMVFTRAYCAAPACNPSRVAILTGVMPATSGVYHNSNPWRPQLPEAITLFQHFRAHGYNVF
jgi:arylsulfatase A-like enzyme